jgi:hypothetical protein
MGRTLLHSTLWTQEEMVSDSLRVFCREFGFPKVLSYDGSMEMVGAKNRASQPGKERQHERVQLSLAEGVVRRSTKEVRKKWYHVHVQKRVPQIDGNYGMRWVSETMSRNHLKLSWIL